MSSLPIASYVNMASNTSFDERRWVTTVRRTLEEELEEDTHIPVCIFKVPKAIMSSKPEAYIPQQIALGPYHYLNSELYDMERYKLAAAKIIQKQLPSLKIQTFVDELIKEEPRIRAYYHRCLDLNEETLAWMMAVDASFVLKFLEVYAYKEGKRLTKVPSRMSHLVDYSGLKSTHNAILRDVLLLENQIPLFVLQMILELQCPSIEQADEILRSMLIGLCNEISPFIIKHGCDSIQVKECAHLLDFLYKVMVPKSEREKHYEIEVVDEGNEEMEGEEGSFAESSYAQVCFNSLWSFLSKLNKGPIDFIKKVILSKPLKLVVKLPWTIISRIPCISMIKEPVERLFFSGDKEETKPEEGSSLGNLKKPPLIEEIKIPSVTELYNSGVRFVATHHDIENIDFDVKAVTFHLPTISLDVHTELVLRNLVAYEASTASGPMVITRYVELMNGIIDTDEDAKLLREKGIILNHLKSDAEVADLWNGMSVSVKLTKVPFLDKVVEDVNKYYSTRWKVKFAKLMKVYVFESWKILTVLAAIFVIFLMTLQSFCSVYSCARILGINTAVLPGL